MTPNERSETEPKEHQVLVEQTIEELDEESLVNIVGGSYQNDDGNSGGAG